MQTVKKLNNVPFFKLEKPDLNNIDTGKIVDILQNNPEALRKINSEANSPKYQYWDKFRYKLTVKEISAEEQWFLLRQARNLSARSTPIKAENSDYFKWNRLESTDEVLHKIDMLAGGQLFPHSDLLSIQNRQTYISRGIIEEAIASSQLEGAHTTRQAARKMIIENRQPKNESEQMILNNYNTINSIEEEYKKQPLSKELLMELHRSLTINTVKLEEQNRFRRDRDQIVVQGQIGNEEFITHIPPKQEFLYTQIEQLIKYANDDDGKGFVHPIIKAIFIHFWIGYLHPFTDGNGRLARALFYWYLLRKGYWIFMYLPISTTIKKAFIQYPMAYIYSEQDNNDLTYFYDFHIKKIMLAIDDFKEYLDKKINENREIDRIINNDLALNDRQKQLIHYMLSDPSPSTSVTSHATINAISRQTAAIDLRMLEENDLLSSRREGKYIKFYPTKKLKKLIS